MVQHSNSDSAQTCRCCEVLLECWNGQFTLRIASRKAHVRGSTALSSTPPELLHTRMDSRVVEYCTKVTAHKYVQCKYKLRESLANPVCTVWPTRRSNIRARAGIGRMLLSTSYEYPRSTCSLIPPRSMEMFTGSTSRRKLGY